MPDPVLISLEYLSLCKKYPGTVTIENIRTHVRHFVEYQKCDPLSVFRPIYIQYCVPLLSARRSWYRHFRASLNRSQTVEEIECLLRGKVTRWRGKAGARVCCEDSDTDNCDNGDECDDLIDLSLIQ